MTLTKFILGLLDIAEKNPECDYFAIQSDDDVRLEFTFLDENRVIAYCGKASIEVMDKDDETYISGSINNAQLTADKIFNLLKKLNERFGFC